MLDITATLNQIKAEKAAPLYTPPVSTHVQWFDRGEGAPRAAIVTEIERPGVVKLTVFNPTSGPSFKRGVQWKRSKHVQDHPNDQGKVHNGTWDYPPEEKPPKAHEQFHIAELEKREEAAQKQKVQYDIAEAKRQELLEAKKKPALAGAAS